MSMLKNSERIYVRALSVTVYPKHLEVLKEYKRKHNIATISSAVRRLIEEFIELKKENEELRREVEELRAILKKAVER